VTIQKKVCILGMFAVGKTSLVRRFVHGAFSERYHTTVGVKIDRASLTVGTRAVNLILWDLNDEDRFQRLNASYLRGSAGCILVVDGTRRATLDHVIGLHAAATSIVGAVPFVLVLNKVDLLETWELEPSALEPILVRGWPVIRGSAKTGLGVKEAFETLARAMTEE
jgi:small GTP-binding protein